MHHKFSLFRRATNAGTWATVTRSKERVLSSRKATMTAACANNIWDLHCGRCSVHTHALPPTHERAQGLKAPFPSTCCVARAATCCTEDPFLSHTLATHARNILADGEKESVGNSKDRETDLPGFLHQNKRRSTAQCVPHTKRHLQFGLVILNGAFSAS